MAAKTFPTEKIRNVALVGHGGSGKTSLAEALLFAAGAITRLGRVEDGTTTTDFDPEEARRRISVSLALAPFEHDGHKVNVIDTPGYADFVSDVAAALRAADLAVFVVSAVEGVEVQTELVWRMAEELGLPRAVFVNKLDRERASFSRTLDQLKEKFGAGVAPLQLPIGEEAEFHGVVELLDDHAVHYVDGTATEGPIPPEMEMEEHSIHDALIEGIVVGDDDLMERYLADETIPVAELAHALADGVASGSVFPVLCGSATKLIGVDRLAQFITEEGPAPTPAAGDGPPVAFVFKTIVDPYVGHVNLFKVLQGTVKADATLVNGRTLHDERLHQLSVMRGKEQEPVSEVPAGDIAAVAKLADTTTGDVLGARGADDRRSSRSSRRRRCSRSRSGPSRRATRTSSRTRCTVCSTRTPRCSSSATPRPTRRCSGVRARRTSASRSARLHSQARRRGRDRGREGRVPRDDHRTRPRPRASTRSRPAGTGSSAWRS